MQMSYFLCIDSLRVRVYQVVSLINMMRKWLFVIEVSVFYVFTIYIFSIMILSIPVFVNMQIR